MAQWVVSALPMDPGILVPDPILNSSQQLVIPALSDLAWHPVLASASTPYIHMHN